MRVKFLLFSVERAQRINRRFLWIGKLLSRFFPKVGENLNNAELGIPAEHYLTASFFSALVYGVLFYALFMALFFVRSQQELLPENIFLSTLIGACFSVLFFFLHIIYPKLIAQQLASGIDDSLIFALKSILIQVSSGIPLFYAMKNISNAKYGRVSAEFREVVQAINAGSSEYEALEHLALKTKSDFLRKTSWQLTSSLRSGASLVGALVSVVETLTNHEIRAIKNYAAELNLWILLYLLVAAAIPTLGITFLVIISSFGGSSMGEIHVISFVLLAFILQFLFIGFIKTRIPKVFA
ncbi:MAG: type II secretion system F family protein [Candidatus Diapherotrites archaeon]